MSKCNAVVIRSILSPEEGTVTDIDRELKLPSGREKIGISESFSEIPLLSPAKI